MALVTKYGAKAGLTGYVGATKTIEITPSASTVANSITIKNSTDPTKTLQLTINTDGTVTIANQDALYLSTPMVDDVMALATVRLTGAGAPSLQNFVTISGNVVQQIAFAGNADNTVPFTIQTPHRVKSGMVIDPHIHWASDTGMTTNKAVFRLDWSIQGHGGTASTVYDGTDKAYTSTITIPTGSAPAAKSHSMTYFTSETPTTNLTASSVIVGQLTRLASSSGTDNYTGLIFLLGLDFHMRFDRLL